MLELLVGALIGVVDLVASGVLGLALAGAATQGTLFFAGPLLGLLVPVGLLFSASTRWWGVGILIGFFLSLIVVGGACVALLSTLAYRG